MTELSSEDRFRIWSQFITRWPIEKLQNLTLEEYNIFKSRIKKMLSLLHNMILEGVFPVYPDTDSCAYCKFADICRKNHLQTLKRVQRSKYFKELRKFHYVPSR